MPPSTPIHIGRIDGTDHEPVMTLEQVLRSAAALPHLGFSNGLLNIGIITGVTALGDALVQSKLMRTTEPVLQLRATFGTHAPMATAGTFSEESQSIRQRCEAVS